MIKDIATAQQIYQKIQQAQNILLVTHQNPDGDGLGVLSAMAQYLETIKKSYQLFCLNEVPASYKFLPQIYKVINNPQIFSQQNFDLIIILDANSLDYAGVKEIIKSIRYPYILINIDHHLTNENFGQLNLCQSSSSSASEIIYDLFRLWQVAITKEMATALLNGIIYDTGIFSNDATTLTSLSASSHLLNLGARHKEINQSVLRNKSLGLLKLWGKAFERLVYNPRYDIAFTVITLKDFEDYQVEPGAIEGLSNYFNELSGAKLTLVLIEKPDGFIKGSFRTTFDDVNVAHLAQLWGGGGHRKASGFSLKGRMIYNSDKWNID
ncbi:DHH family phosphoesterase [Patescibacteria group bacterium]|nr:DHH family phosphoesterase [Patescibacteria group bacterium]